MYDCDTHSRFEIAVCYARGRHSIVLLYLVPPIEFMMSNKPFIARISIEQLMWNFRVLPLVSVSFLIQFLSGILCLIDHLPNEGCCHFPVHTSAKISST